MKGGGAHGYLCGTDSDRHFDREHLQSGLPDLQKELTAPQPKDAVNSFDLILLG